MKVRNIKIMSNSDLRERALLVKLSTSKFGTQRKDQDATSQTANDQNATKASVTVTKSLIPKDCPELKALVKEMAAVSNIFRMLTGPWDENGFRIIAGTAFAALQETIEGYTLKIDSLKEDLRKAMPQIIADAPRHLGLMFDASQYPPIGEIVDSFNIVFDIETIPDRSDVLQIGLDQDRIDRLVKDATAKDVQRTKDLTVHTHTVVSEAISGMIDSLDNFGDEIENSKRTKTFRDTMVTNIENVTSTLKGLNITGDPALDALADNITAKLTKISAPALRGDKIKGDNRTAVMIEKDAADLREAVSKSAKQISEDLDGVFGIAS